MRRQDPPSAAPGSWTILPGLVMIELLKQRNRSASSALDTRHTAIRELLRGIGRTHGMPPDAPRPSRRTKSNNWSPRAATISSGCGIARFCS